jgi:acyl-CoA synthetase (AMP-forming)/AMP-acid ligase II
VGDIHVAIVDGATHAALGPDTIGEIWVGGTGPALGYWGHPEATEATFAARLADGTGPYLRTGDMGFVDADGFLTITGRVKDLIVVHGKNHYPSDIEQTVEAAHPALRPHFAAAFSVERGNREALVVVVEVRHEAARDLDVDAVARDVMRRVNAEHEIPVDEVVLLKPSQIPKTTSGKVQRAQCRQMWQDGAFQAHAVIRRVAQA